uniref:Uncharacterized protein n=1 Tax=Sphaerodactylus townsendi TaxID=933632 RepID=A0ACB8FPG5_9SAUR
MRALSEPQQWRSQFSREGASELQGGGDAERHPGVGDRGAAELAPAKRLFEAERPPLFGASPGQSWDLGA